MISAKHIQCILHYVKENLYNIIMSLDFANEVFLCELFYEIQTKTASLATPHRQTAVKDEIVGRRTVATQL